MNVENGVYYVNIWNGHKYTTCSTQICCGTGFFSPVEPRSMPKYHLKLYLEFEEFIVLLCMQICLFIFLRNYYFFSWQKNKKLMYNYIHIWIQYKISYQYVHLMCNVISTYSYYHMHIRMYAWFFNTLYLPYTPYLNTFICKEILSYCWWSA